jgi:hypothetical protein
MPEFRVPVVVFTTVVAADYSDAVAVAERSVTDAVLEASEREVVRCLPAEFGRPVIGFTSHGRTFETAVDGVMSADRAWTRDSRSPGLAIVDIRGREVVDGT